MMKILMVYPQFPVTFWSFKHALKFVSKKSSYPPLGLLTVAAMLPDEWEKKVVDMNVIRLTDEDIRWADYVFISAMAIQKESVAEVMRRCHENGAVMVAGGPLFTMEPEEYHDIDHLVLGEAEAILPEFLHDLVNDRAGHLYKSKTQPDLSLTPLPMWSLINMKNYSAMSIQYSRGCPFNCEFCDIVILNGHRPRTKGSSQIITELDTLYKAGWRNGVFIVDDNFIGNKKKLKAEILPALIEWRKRVKYPFSMYTEASINLADDDELIKLMVEAGFDVVFIGIETPNKDSLEECAKVQNQNRDLVSSVKKLQESGLEVQGGFIIGFDNDTESIFQTQIDFIQRSGIVTAMVGLLNAPLGTRLYKRLQKENRLLKVFSGNNTDSSLNFIPKMNPETLVSGYKQVINTIYSPNQFYERIKTFLKVYKPPRSKAGKVQVHHFRALLGSIWFMGVRGKGRRHYWKLFVSYLVESPPKFARFIVLTVYGYHFYKVALAEAW